MFSEVRHQWILCKIFREEGVRCITHSSGWPSRKIMEFNVLWGASAASSVCGFSSPILQKLFPVAVKERAEQRGSWQIDRLTDKEETVWSQAYTVLCKCTRSQSPANTPACSHQAALISAALLSILSSSRETTASYSEDLLEFSYIPIFQICSSQLLHKTLHKALSFPNQHILNAIFEIWNLLKAPRLMLLCSSASCLKK